MEALKCIIVEDQAPAQRILQTYISDTSELTLSGTFNNALDALEYLKEHTVDLMFLDIHLPKLSGMDFLRILDNPPKVILITAFSDYAVESYNYQVVDYLLKPFSFKRFGQAIEKVMASMSTEPTKAHVIIKTGHDYVNVPVKDIYFIHSDSDYTEVITASKKHLSSSTLKGWLEELSPQFVQVHKSYIVNKALISRVSGNNLELSNEKHDQIPIGRAFKEGVIRLLKGQ